ncbi:MAG: hypothetical protein DWQ47_01180 [Acidobacteria bacterium]|nr:MAG: hypothetical protein DWQ32_11640 [Acidobacteriota bacterium]REK04114.1 MAG: hypothetical protein DWQ38_01165 [Acidobacteriota bacterium]REK15276.1 MAG: hypothetical protein DWQ43_17330 [Acidobacteriota bacterium]REK46366.1 MAG: hypothetical protein DWQ47_01180 [Acidobacteriota bacterium]
MKTFRTSVLRLLAVLFAFSAVAAMTSSGPSVSRSEPTLFDHHVHLLSPDLVKDWKSLGVPFSRPDEFYSAVPKDVAEGRVKKAFVLSMAYLYGSDWFAELKFGPKKELESVRRENDFIANVVASNSEKLIGFCSVNPQKEYAFEELERCSRKKGMKGVKLHLLNSGVELGDNGHISGLRKIFGWAERDRVPLMIHLNAYDPMGPSEMAEAFANLLAAFPDLEVYIAHLGGSGGYSERGRKILRAFVDRIAKDKSFSTMNINFEISAVVLLLESDGVEPPSEEQLALLTNDLRDLGLERIVFGTDHPSFAAGHYLETLRDKLGLNTAEIETIISNKGALMK